PDILIQVGVVVIDAGVVDGDDDLAAAGGDVPGGGGVDVGAGGAAGLAGVAEVPLVAELRDGGDAADVGGVVRLCFEDAAGGLVGAQGGRDGDAGRQAHLVEARHQAELLAEAGARGQGGPRRARQGVGPEANEDLRGTVSVGFDGKAAQVDGPEGAGGAG